MRIFLTGATGFLGTVLLRDLLIKGHTVTALVRSQNGLSARERLKLSLLDFDPQFRWDQINERQLNAVEGDAALECFGMSQDFYEHCAASSDLVIHNAACTALETAWDVIEPVNVGGTREAIEFTSYTRTRKLVYVSSAYVAGDRTGVVLEDELIMTEGFRNGYERSKAIAENEVKDAASSGKIHYLIVRPSIIVGDSHSGYMRPKHHFFDLIFRLISIRQMVQDTIEDSRFRIPGDPRATKNFVPVDHVAHVISLLIESEEAWGNTFHVTDPAPIRLEALSRYVQTALDWPGLNWCPVGEIKDLSVLEKRFFRSIRLYEKYFWHEAYYDQRRLKSVLKAQLPIPEMMSQRSVDKMVKFIQEKFTRRDKIRREKVPQSNIFTSGQAA